MNRPKILSDIVITCTKDVLKIFDVNNDPQIRDNNLICGNDEGMPILTSLTVQALDLKGVPYRHSPLLVIGK